MGLLLPMLLSAGIGLAGQLFSASSQASAQDKALAAQTASTDKQLALSKEIFESNKAGAQPWVDAGKEALTTLTGKIKSGEFDMSKYGMDDLVQDPGYQFRLEQGSRALDRTASARGNFLSGDQLKGLTDYNQESASQEFGNAFDRTMRAKQLDYNTLNDQSQQGLGAQNALAGQSTQFAANQNNILQRQASATGTAAVNTGNAWADAATGSAKVGNNAIENYMLYDRLAKLGVG